MKVEPLDLDFEFNRLAPKISILMFRNGDNTMANTFYPSNDAEFAVWLTNLIKKATVYKTELNLTNDRLSDLQVKLAAFNENVALKRQKKDESTAQTALVKNSRTDLNKDVGSLNNAFKAIDGLPSNIIEELGLNVGTGNFSPVAPSTPADLVVTGTSDGTNSLKWKRGGNRSGAMFIIEAKVGDSGNWTMIDAVTGVVYKHRNQSPGVKIQYRVKAKRGEFESGYTNTAVIYS